MADTVFCNGTDLSTYLTPISKIKMIGIPPAVGSDYAIPGYVGAIPAQLGRGPRMVSCGGLILGWDYSTGVPLPQENVELAREEYLSRVEAFSAAVFQGGDPFTLTWRTGPPGSQVDRQALARYMGGIDDIEELTPWAGRVMVEFLLLTPYWQ